MSDNFNDYLKFRKMITPVIIQILFWIMVVLVVLSGLYAMTQGGQFITGLLMILLGPIFIRMMTELIIVTFKINEGIQTIAKKK